MHQLILNLITNASESMGEEDGILQIGTHVMEADRDYLANTYVDDNLAAGSYVVLEVSDTGNGMNEETLEKIFDPFLLPKLSAGAWVWRRR